MDLKESTVEDKPKEVKAPPSIDEKLAEIKKQNKNVKENNYDI